MFINSEFIAPKKNGREFTIFEQMKRIVEKMLIKKTGTGETASTR